jgi:DNA (cytosine-5)-methyltransferase 1
MPEAAIYEDCDLGLGKHEIRPDWPDAIEPDGHVHTEAEPAPMQRRTDQALGRSIAPAICLHNSPPHYGNSTPGGLLAAAVAAILLISMNMPSVHRTQHKPEHDSEAEQRDQIDAEFLRCTDPPALAVGPDFEIVDLFAGCGGLTLGAIEGALRAGKQAGLALAIDNDPNPLGVLQQTLGVPDRCIAIADLSNTLGTVGGTTTAAERSLFGGIAKGSLLLAGPPCQGHSALNNHTRHDDPRNDLYLAVGRVARILKPTAVIVENVRGVGSDRRCSVDRCMSILEELGYQVTARRVDLSTIGVPQRRVRHVLVASQVRSFQWDFQQTPKRNLRWAIGDLVGLEGTTLFDTPASPTPVNLDRMRWLIENDEFNLPNERRPKCHQSDHSYRSMYGRLRWDAPAQTITSGFGSMGQGRYVHPSKPRTLTPHEAARLQFLPDFVAFDGIQHRTRLAEMIGNVAPPLLTTVLVEALSVQGLL